MTCYLHPDTTASAFCRSCGRPLCPNCQHVADGTVFCQEHLPVGYSRGAAQGSNSPGSNPYTQSTSRPGTSALGASPALAFILGWIPGVGAIYNGQYIKGLVHAVIFGVIVSLLNSNEHDATLPFLGIMLGAFVFYMPFEAYHTARKRHLGMAADEWSSLVSQGQRPTRAPAGPVFLIGIGVLFLLDTLHLIEFREIGRFWPVLLIVAGAYMLYSRVTGVGRIPPYSPPFDQGVSGETSSEPLEARREQ